MNKRIILALLIAVALVSTLVAACAAPAPAPAPTPAPAPAPSPAPTPAQPPETINWKVSVHLQMAQPWQAAEMMCNKVNEASAGRLFLELLGPGTVVPASKEFDAVDTNVLDACYTSLAFNMDKFPTGSILQTRVGGMTADGMTAWYLTGGGSELYNRAIEGYNVKILHPPLLTPPEVWLHTNKPINSTADVKGLKIRTAGDGGNIFTTLGASVIMLPGGEVYESMQRGVIDACELGGFDVDWRLALHEVSDYAYASASRAPTDGCPFFVNKERWAELTPDLQGLVSDAWQSTVLSLWPVFLMDEVEGIKNFKEYGVEVLKVPTAVEDEVARVAAEFYKEVSAEDPFYAEILESQLEFEKTYKELMSMIAPET